MYWLWVGAVLLVLIVMITSFIHFGIILSREGKNDRLVCSTKALFGLLQYKFEIPILELNWAEGLFVKTEQINQNDSTKNKDQQKNLTLRKIISYYEKNKRLKNNVFGFSGWLTDTLSHVKCTKLRWETYIGIGDAPDTAVTTGIVWGLKSSLLGYIFQYIQLETKPEIAVNPQYHRTQFSTELLCIVKIRLGYAIFAGLFLIIRILKVKGGVRTWQNILFKA